MGCQTEAEMAKVPRWKITYLKNQVMEEETGIDPEKITTII
jgi:hypothetical protein